MTTKKPFPKDYPTVSAYLIVPNAVEAIDFYEKAFGALKGHRMTGPDGKSTMHADMKIGNSVVMMTDENPAWGHKGANALGGSPVTLHLVVEDCDAFMERAAGAGCTVTMPPANMFWGDRYGQLKDPFGLSWSVATPIESLSNEELAQRHQDMMAKIARGEAPTC